MAKAVVRKSTGGYPFDQPGAAVKGNVRPLSKPQTGIKSKKRRVSASGQLSGVRVKRGGKLGFGQ